MRHHDACDVQFARQLHNELVDHIAGDWIKTGGGFVIQHHGGLHDNGARQRHAFALSTRKRSGHDIDLVVQSNQVQYMLNHGARFGAASHAMFD